MTLPMGSPALLVLQASDLGALRRLTEQVRAQCGESRAPSLHELVVSFGAERIDAPARLAAVATSTTDMGEKLGQALEHLADPECRRIKGIGGVYFDARPVGAYGHLAVLFPGEGSQYPHMLQELCLYFPEARARFDLLDRSAQGDDERYLPSSYIFPPPRAPGAADEPDERLWRMAGAVEAVFTANRAASALLDRLHVVPDVLAGHSTGEYNALLAAGAIDVDDEGLVQYLRRGHLISRELGETGRVPEGELLAAGPADPAVIGPVLERHRGSVWSALDNCPSQLVLFALANAAPDVVTDLRKAGVFAQPLPFGRAYHTELFEPARAALQPFLDDLPVRRPRRTVYSCFTAAPYPDEPGAIRQVLSGQWTAKVRFRETVEAMYEAGVRLFVEAGPRGNLRQFVDDTLRGRDHLAVAIDQVQRPGLLHLQHVIARLAAAGVALDLRLLRPREFEGEARAGKSRRGLLLELGLPLMALDAGAPRATPERRPVGPAQPPVSSPVLTAPVQDGPASRAASVVPSEPGPPPTVRATRAPGPPWARSEVVSAFLHTMGSYTAAQEAVTLAVLRRRRPVPRNHSNGMSAHRTMRAERASRAIGLAHTRDDPPGRVMTESPERLVIVITFDPRSRHLRDHALGARPSVLDADLSGLIVVPLAISLEFAARAAARLRPGIVTAVRAVRASQWIILDDEPVEAELVATARPGSSEVEVTLTQRGSTNPAVGALVEIDGTAAHTEPVEVRGLADDPAARIRSGELYDSGMFHGPTFRGVASVDAVGERGLLGTLRVPPDDDLGGLSHGLVSPLHLDAAGQLVGFWTSASLAAGYVVFPYQVQRIELTSSPLPVGSELRARVQVTEVTDVNVAADIDVLDGPGRCLALRGWTDKRVYMPAELFQLRHSPATTWLSDDWSLPLQLAGLHSGAACRRVTLDESFLSSDGGIWWEVLASLVLSRAERVTWRSMRGSARAAGWLAGHLAAKDAVRALLSAADPLPPADVPVVSGPSNRPEVSAELIPALQGHQGHRRARILLSISHSGPAAVAVAADGTSCRGVGVGIERLDRAPERLGDVALDAREMDVVTAAGGGVGSELARQVWCAKEAAAKALMYELSGGPTSLRIKAFDASKGSMELEPTGLPACAMPWGAGRVLAHASRKADLVVAIAWRN
jgi:malonyl CoA-acyl carrier protein transacylase/phosphopantetheinyl transferase (holo-ACP synthase)